MKPHELRTIYNVGDAEDGELELIEKVVNNMGVEYSKDLVLVVVQIQRSLRSSIQGHWDNPNW